MFRHSCRTPVVIFSMFLPLLAGCAASDMSGPEPRDGTGGIVFLDFPTDGLVGEPLPPLRVRLADPDGDVASSATGSLVLRIDGAPAGPQGEHVYELFHGEAVVRDLVVDSPGTAVRLVASSGELVGVSPPFAVVEDYDAVRLNVDGEAAVYVEGGDNRGERVQRGASVEAGAARVGFFRRLAGGSNQALAFGVDRAPAYRKDVRWTSGADTIDLPLSGPVVLDLTVWVMDGSPAAIEDLARNAAGNLDRLWSRERAGFVVGNVDVIDVRHDPDVASLVGSEATNTWLDELKDRIGAHAGRINVYAVPEVRQGGRSLAGVARHGGNVIALAPAGWTGATLGHEIGHNFGLDHTDDFDDFDAANVMHSRGGRRAFFSEGQIARMHFSRTALMSGVLGSNGAGDGTVSHVPDESLPPLTLRLWADGSLPAAGYRGP